MTQKLYDQLSNSVRGINAATMRDVLLPLILGNETNGILYWVGKDLARQFPVASVSELVTLTHQLGLGNLKLITKKDNTRTWELSGPVVEERVGIKKENTSFTLEAGFLAKEIEFQLSRLTEAKVTELKKDRVTITTESEAVTDEGEVELVTFIKLADQALTSETNAESTEAPEKVPHHKLTRSEKRQQKIKARAAKKAAKLAAKQAKQQAKKVK
ncbi:YslB family protein [Lactobacillus alvi]|uniref:YslB family protein n=1 Tax=Limosilactobacillus alvi TaxID=990412 RepID=A0ABS2EM16_9LACO|nr:YslB family protein [Limosilactobacillus alvi]MBM6753285.1 YslB family protein [Limosilactobacillus alvi]